jgi:hypothetical protein
MARRRKSSGGGASLAITAPWALLLSWMFCPPICILLIVLLLVLVRVKVYAFFKKN